ncbi:hypothetical protein B0T19DRAFT_10621 [Cercophora scortea]|uniref:Uncharacterized protein n=1 Tax=Cercophora scortea TaxID=314031 RepID=A0AAE0J2K9_9PEZI|nr:hypothetical protein B0T19DRAFT_10621 [Cercophora scortea]
MSMGLLEGFRVSFPAQGGSWSSFSVWRFPRLDPASRPSQHYQVVCRTRIEDCGTGEDSLVSSRETIGCSDLIHWSVAKRNTQSRGTSVGQGFAALETTAGLESRQVPILISARNMTLHLATCLEKIVHRRRYLLEKSSRHQTRGSVYLLTPRSFYVRLQRQDSAENQSGGVVCCPTILTGNLGLGIDKQGYRYLPLGTPKLSSAE